MEKRLFKTAEDRKLDRRLEALNIKDVSEEDKEEILEFNRLIESVRQKPTFKVEDLYWDWKYKKAGEQRSIGKRFKKYADKDIFEDVVVHKEGKNTTVVYAIDSAFYRYAKSKMEPHNRF